MHSAPADSQYRLTVQGNHTTTVRMAQTIIAFDLYGTLLSTESIATELAKIYGQEKATALAARARTLQLEYTWRSNSMSEWQERPLKYAQC